MYTTQSYVSWSYSGSDHSGFILERLPHPLGAWESMAEYPKSITGAVDTHLTYSQIVQYRVSATNIYGDGPTNSTTVFIQASPPYLYAWQHGTTTQSVAFWNFLGLGTMSLSRSADGGATWPITTYVSPTSGGYYYIDDPVVVGATYSYKVQESAYPGLPYSNTASVTIQVADTSRVKWGLTGDAGYQFNDTTDTVWELHTASMHEINNFARRDLGITRWLIAGDLGYVSNTYRGGYDGQIGRMIGPSSSILATPGNHEFTDMGVTNYDNYFHMFKQPTGERCYTSSQGPVMLFSMTVTSSTDRAISQSRAQYTWLSTSLSDCRTNRPDIVWRVALMHVPTLCSSGSHNQNIYLQQVPWHDWGIDAVCSGHVHWVERLESGSCVFHVNSLLGSDKRIPTVTSLYTKWMYVSPGATDENGYIWSLFDFTQNTFTMSFYSGSTKINDTGTTEMVNGIMSNGSLVLLKPWYAAPVLAASQSGYPQVYVSWSFAGDFSMSLHRSVDSGSTWPVTTSLDPGVLNYTDNTVSTGGTYWYKVREVRFPTEPFSNVGEIYVTEGVAPMGAIELTASAI